jgi:hypothetical protein
MFHFLIPDIFSNHQQRFKKSKQTNFLKRNFSTQKNCIFKMPKGGGTAGGGKRGSGINCSKPADPAFLKRFKEKVGFREKVTTIDDKVSKLD